MKTPEELEEFEKRLNLVLNALHDLPLEQQQSILIGHLQRVIGNRSDNKFKKSFELAGEACGDLMYRITRINMISSGMSPIPHPDA